MKTNQKMGPCIVAYGFIVKEKAGDYKLTVKSRGLTAEAVALRVLGGKCAAMK